MLEIAPTASMAVVTLAGRAMLSAVFLTACVAKLVDRSGSRRSLIEFGFPSSAVPPLSIGVPIAELMVAAALLPVASVRAGAAAALLLLAAFSITIATALARGRHVECRCFGQLTSGIVSWRTLARNAVLAVVALAVLLADLGSPPPSLFDAVSTLRGAVLVAWTVGLAAVAIIGLGAWAFVHLLRAHGRLLLRVEHLEQQLVHAGLADALGDLTGEAEGLPPGSPVPVMTADDIEGGPADWKDLLDRSRSLLLLFTSPQCAPCRELRPEIRAWQQRLGSQLRFGLASDGRVEEIRREAVQFGVTDPLVDRDLRLFHAFEAKGTPSAVLVRSDGTIGSHLASGPAAIRALLAREAAKNDARSAAAPAIAPAPGTALPQLRLRRLDGASSTVSDFIREPTVVFWNPRCGYCRAMHDKLRRWERDQHPRAPRMVVVSSGDEDSIRAEGFEAPVMLDPDFAYGRGVGIGGTPMAVLVDAESRIASAPAAGPDAVLALINRSAEALSA
jgi:thiol-disulfide isomerase/thioredoxin